MKKDQGEEGIGAAARHNGPTTKRRCTARSAHTFEAASAGGDNAKVKSQNECEQKKRMPSNAVQQGAHLLVA